MSQNAHQTYAFEVLYMGNLKDVNLGKTETRDLDVQLIDRVEEAQLEGRLPIFPNKDEVVKMTISKHGIKMVDFQKKTVLQRHPLHAVAQIVYYTDSFNRSNLALKIGQLGRSVYDCHLFQCQSEEQAQMICQSVKDMFDAITSNAF